MTKKGQAAMEFLMTYGWAILAAIIVIGILGYYYFSKDVINPTGAIVNSPFYAQSWNAKTTGVNIELKNNGGETYTIQNMTIAGCGSVAAAPGDIATGATLTVNVPCTLTEGDTFQGNIVVTYLREGSSLEQTTTGSITQTVTAA